MLINRESPSYIINGFLALRIYVMLELLVDAAKKLSVVTGGA
jgi:hypothetical protein